VSTVLQAYRLLEDSGAIEARPQSGHYVRAACATAPEPVPCTRRSEPKAVDLTSLVVRLTRRVGRDDLIGMGCGFPEPSVLPLKALDRLIAQVSRDNPDAHAYSVSPGHKKLRRAVANRLVAAGCALGPDDLIVTAGCQQGIYLCLQALTKPGDNVVVEAPTYFGLLEALSSLGLNAIEVPSHPRDGIDLDRLSSVLARERVAACAMVPNFSNPLGSLLSDAKKQRLLDILGAAGVPLIEDDVYGELGFDGKRPIAVKSLDQTGNVLYCGSVSKTLSPGLRVGWLAPGRYYDKVNRLKLVSGWACSTVPQLAVAEYLQSGGYDRHLRRLRRTYREHFERMSLAVQRCFPPGTRIARPRGGQFLWVELPAWVDSIRLFEDADDAGVTLAPGVMFSATGRFRNFIRLNYSVIWNERVEAAVRTVGRLAEQQSPT